MYSHMMVGSNDLDRSRKFYDAVFGAVGAAPGVKDPKGRLMYQHNGGYFMVTKPIDGAAATNGNGSTIGFGMTGPDQAAAWHKEGVENGGKSVEILPASARTPACISLICAIRTATNCARSALRRERLCAMN